MMLDNRLAVYLFRIAQKVKNGEYINAPMVCPECGDDAEEVRFESNHIIFCQPEEGVDLYFVAVACQGYWGVDPSLVGLPKGNWS